MPDVLDETMAPGAASRLDSFHQRLLDLQPLDYRLDDPVARTKARQIVERRRC